VKRLYDYDAILADLRRRIPQHVIAENRGVSPQLVSKIAVANALGKDADSEFGLPPGRWVLDPRRRIVVFEVAS
jgi:hypothetical protein